MDTFNGVLRGEGRPERADDTPTAAAMRSMTDLRNLEQPGFNPFKPESPKQEKAKPEREEPKPTTPVLPLSLRYQDKDEPSSDDGAISILEQAMREAAS